MKTPRWFSPNLILIAVTLALACQAGAQCPQICDQLYNTAVGDDALLNNTIGVQNTAVGFQALYSNTGGGYSSSFNTAVGSQALYSNTYGGENIAIGASALYGNTTGSDN